MNRKQVLANAKFKVGQRVWHDNREEWVTITRVEISEKRLADYGILEVNYIAENDEGRGCWGYEDDLSATNRRSYRW